MVEYNCTICNFKTHIRCHYDRHCNTKKHKNNIEKHKSFNENENEKKYGNVTQCYPMLPECYPNVTRMLPKPKKSMLPECYPNVTQMLPECDPDIKKNQSKPQCPFCLKFFATRHGKSRHIKKGRCKLEKNNELENIKKEMKELKEKNHSLTNNINNLTKINFQNNGTINYLNINFSNIQPIEQFLENLKNKIQLRSSDRKCLLNTYNECGIDAFAETFSIIMKKYQSEQVEEGVLPTMPIVCTDGNLRSFKEFHEDGWKTTQSNSSIDKMIDISNDQIYESEKTKVFITQKERKKIHNRIKKDNTLIDLEDIRNKYDDDLVYKNKNYSLNSETLEKIESKQDLYDFSSINDDYIEKYSKIKD